MIKRLLKHFNVDVKAVKPGIVPVILEDVRAHVGRDKLIVSIAAAVSINNIQSRLEEKSKVKVNYFKNYIS
jgi:pyrroline-5-carboxylate reductase